MGRFKHVSADFTLSQEGRRGGGGEGERERGRGRERENKVSCRELGEPLNLS